MCQIWVNNAATDTSVLAKKVAMEIKSPLLSEIKIISTQLAKGWTKVFCVLKQCQATQQVAMHCNNQGSLLSVLWIP